MLFARAVTAQVAQPTASPTLSTRLLVPLAFALLSGCAAAPHPHAADPVAERLKLMRIDADFSRMSVEKGTQEAFRAHLAEDARSFQAGAILEGRTAIVSDLAESPDQPRSVLRWEPLGGEVSGDLGYTFGHYDLQITKDGVRIPRHGKYVTIWRRDATGGWKIVADIGSPDP